MSCTYTAQGFLMCQAAKANSGQSRSTKELFFDIASKTNQNSAVAFSGQPIRYCDNCTQSACNKKMCKVSCKCNFCSKADGKKGSGLTNAVVDVSKQVYFCPSQSRLSNTNCTNENFKCLQ